MTKKKYWKITFLTSSYLLIGCFMSYAQESSTDNTNNIIKYNHDFKGIGPKVYILPPPKSKTEQLIELFDSSTRKDFAKNSSGTALQNLAHAN